MMAIVSKRTMFLVVALIGQLLASEKSLSVSARPGSSHWKLPPDTHAVVTGGTKGIGRAVVEELAAGLGIRVLTCARNEQELMACVHEWKAAGMDCTGVVADVAVKEGRDTLLQGIRQWLGGKPLDILGTYESGI
jgi:Tropinone reductase 1